MELRHKELREALLHGTPASTDPELEFYAESELIEDYLEGSLSEAESNLFDRNFLVTDERREHLNEVRLLKRYSSGSFEFDAAKIESPDRRPFSRLILTAIAFILAFALIAIFFLSR